MQSLPDVDVWSDMWSLDYQPQEIKEAKQKFLKKHGEERLLKAPQDLSDLERRWLSKLWSDARLIVNEIGQVCAVSMVNKDCYLNDIAFRLYLGLGDVNYDEEKEEEEEEEGLSDASYDDDDDEEEEEGLGDANYHEEEEEEGLRDSELDFAPVFDDLDDDDNIGFTSGTGSIGVVSFLQARGPHNGFVVFELVDTCGWQRQHQQWGLAIGAEIFQVNDKAVSEFDSVEEMMSYVRIDCLGTAVFLFQYQGGRDAVCIHGGA